MIRKIKIAHITGWIHVGGKENGMVNLVNAMPSEIFENHVYVFRRGGILLQRINRDKCNVVELGDKLGNDLSLYFKLFTLFRRYGIHILHTRSWGTLLEGIISAKFARVPLIIHGEHGLVKAGTQKHVLTQRLFWRMTDNVMCVSEMLRKKLVRKIGYPLHKIQVIKNGVDISRFDIDDCSYEIKSTLGLKPETPLFGSIGRLVPVKNYALLVRAAKLVIDRIPEAHLVFVGDGPERQKLETLAQDLGIVEQIHFLAWRKDAHKIYQALDAFVLSSVSEGMSNSILEAMASRKPVVATEVGGNPELVVHERTGFLVPSNDAMRMGEAIIRILLNPEQGRRLGEAGRQRVEEQYDLNFMIRNYEKMYINIARRKFKFHPELEEKIKAHFTKHDKMMFPTETHLSFNF